MITKQNDRDIKMNIGLYMGIDLLKSVVKIMSLKQVILWIIQNIKKLYYDQKVMAYNKIESS